MMSTFVYEMIIYICEGLIAAVFLMNMLTPRCNRVVQMAVWCGVIMLLKFYIPIFTHAHAITMAIAEWIFIAVGYEEDMRKKNITYLFLEGMTLCTSLMSYGLYTKLGNGTLPWHVCCSEDDCTFALLYLLILSVLISIIFQFIRKFKGIELPWVVGTQVVIGVGECAAVLVIARSGASVISSVESKFLVVATVCMVATNVSIGMLAPYLLELISFMTHENYGKELSDMEFKYYEIAVENDKKISAIRHDISNHIQIVYSLLKNGDNQKGLELVNELKRRYEYVNPIVYCKNPVVNIILSNKRTEAEQHGIETHVRVKTELEDVPFSDYDLTTVICNLLDNAVRGCICSNQSHPRLSIEILNKNNYLVIRVLNSCLVSMNIESTDRITTTKSKSQSHGIGMTLISGIARKYRGDFVVSAQNGLFTATVVLSMK